MSLSSFLNEKQFSPRFNMKGEIIVLWSLPITIRTKAESALDLEPYFCNPCPSQDRMPLGLRPRAILSLLGTLYLIERSRSLSNPYLN